MADPSPPFRPSLMTQAFKEGVPLQSEHKLLLFQNILSVSLPSPFSSFQTPIPIFLRSNSRAMVLVKSSGFSRSKGKKAVYNPPVEQETGEEALYSESDHSDKEEAWRDPDSECAPLIDPWYNIYPSFPKIPGDYVSLPPSRVWLALCWRNLNTSWAPMSSSVYDLVIRQGISLPMPIHFEFGSGTAQGWKEWVNSKLFDTGFMGLLQRPMFWKPSSYLEAYPTSETSTTSAIWFTGGAPPPTHSSFLVANSPSPSKTWLTNYFYRFLVMLILPP